jgi:hypothetical protein
VKDPTHPANDDAPGASVDPDPEDLRLADLLGRIRTSDDPAADLLRPLSDAERGAMADRVLAALGSAAPERVPAADLSAAERLPAAEPSAAEPLPSPEPPVAERLASAAPPRLPSHRPRARAPERFRFLWVLPIAAAVLLAALSLVMSHGGPQLVAYRLEVEGDADQRGDAPTAAGPVVLRPETKLRVKLAPAEPVRDVSLRLLVVRGGKAAVIAPPAMADGHGGFVIEAAAAGLLGEQVDGPVELVFAVGHPLPEDGALVRLAVDRKADLPASVRITRRAAVLQGFSPKQGSLGWSGCQGVLVGPVCQVGRDQPLHVWAEGADAIRFTVRVDGRALAVSPVPVGGGLRWSVTPPPGAGLLTLHLSDHEVLRLPLLDALPSPVAAAEALRRDGKLTEAEATLNEAERDPTARLSALRVRAKIARRRGDAARAAALREEAIAAERAAGRASDEVDDQLARVHELLYQERALAEARRRLEALPAPAAGDGEHQVKLDYYRGLVAGEVGDLRTAITALRAARAGARRFVMPTYENVVAAPLADMLSALGRDDEAAAILAEAEPNLGATADRCDHASHLMNHGAVLLRAGRAAEAAPRLAEAARVADGVCPRVRADVITNLAFLSRDTGATAEARALLAQARAAQAGPDRWMDVWQDRLSAELLLDGDPRGALAAADKVGRAGEASLSPELRCDAALGRARALDRLGHDAAAALAYAAAERALDLWGSLVPLGEGRQAFLDRQERAPRAWLDFLRRRAARPGATPAAAAALGDAARRSVARFYRVLGDADRAGALAADVDDGYATAVTAYRVARARIDAALAGGQTPAAGDLAAVRARIDASPAGGQPPATGDLAAVRARIDAPLAGRQAGDLAAGGDRRDASLPAPTEGELVLVYHPLPDGWLGVAASSAGAVWKALGPVDPGAGRAALAAALLEPFRDSIGRAASLRIHAHRALAGVAFHALPWDGALLLDRAPVLYGVDLPAPAAAAACAGPPSALVVADSRENLAGAGAAAGLVSAALRARGLTVQLLRGDEARRDAVRRALADPCVQLFHYEGHAVFEGRDGVDASLLLADGRLRAAEILRLPRVPAVAVLSGCSTGEADGLGLAHAFLARGSAEVLATSAPVADATAALVARRLYPPTGSLAPLAATWRSAFVALRRDGASTTDLDAYRILRR